MFTPLAVKIALHRRDNSLCIVNEEILEVLKYDVIAIENYRMKSDRVCIETLKLWFPNVQNIETIFEWLDTNRDFIYTKYGLVLLESRYIYPGEPLQYAMLRIAKIFSDKNYKLWRIMYDLLSTGMLHVSHIFVEMEKKSCDNIVSGESCQLLVGDYINCYNDMTQQTEKLKSLISSGIHIGYCASNVPKYTGCSNDIYSGFDSLVKTLNAVNVPTVNGRRPNITLYIPIHNDTIFEALHVHDPSKDTINNVDVGLMVPDYFIKCVQDNKPWYLFDASMQVNYKTLADYTGDDYVRMYNKWVYEKRYTVIYMAKYIFNSIIQSIILNAAPFIIWSDNVNCYNNQKHLGIIKTLDTCANITSFSNSVNTSTSIEMSCNMAMYKDFPDVLERGYKFMSDEYNIYYQCKDFDLPELARYAYMIGYISTLALNIFMGEYRKKREIGLNPLGVYDMALLANENHVKVCRVISEALYKGAVQSSCDHYTVYGVLCENYDGSEFSKGRPQWDLRGNKPSSNWSLLVESMKHGMANSMLTSQAPTTRICLLTGVSESVTLPIMDAVISKDITEIRNKCIGYGIMYRSMYIQNIITIPDDVNTQIDMYTVSSDFIDHSQSTMFTIDRDKQKICSLLVKTFKAKLKTAIFGIMYKN